MIHYNKLKLIFQFYRNFIIASFVITFICALLFEQYGLKTLSVLLVFKLFSFLVIFYLTNEYKKKEYYYYFNLGLSKILLWGGALIFDFLFFLFILFSISPRL